MKVLNEVLSTEGKTKNLHTVDVSHSLILASFHLEKPLSLLFKDLYLKLFEAETDPRLRIGQVWRYSFDGQVL